MILCILLWLILKKVADENCSQQTFFPTPRWAVNVVTAICFLNAVFSVCISPWKTNSPFINLVHLKANHIDFCIGYHIYSTYFYGYNMSFVSSWNWKMDFATKLGDMVLDSGNIPCLDYAGLTHALRLLVQPKSS